MSTKRFALIAGLVMVLMGVLSFIPLLSSSVVLLPDLQVATSYGMFLGYFPMNIFNKLALIGFGIAGIMSAQSTSLTAAITYSRTVCIIFGALAILGLFPMMNTVYGYWPLFGGEVIAHGVFAILGGYFGYAAPARSSTGRPAHV